MRLRIVSVVLVVASTLVLESSSATAGTNGCPAKPFAGSITRSEDSATGQPGVGLRGDEVKRGLAFDFGTARNTTAYLATYALDPDDLGSTIAAPQGEAVVTIFLRPETGDLAPGKRLKTPRDVITVTVDSGGGAHATTAGARAKARVLEFSDDEVCFSIDYRDDLQRVKGRVHAVIS
ncbi:MAG: hypothetical protein WD598_12090 [Acidimicrobiia bacterium]